MSEMRRGRRHLVEVDALLAVIHILGGEYGDVLPSSIHMTVVLPRDVTLIVRPELLIDNGVVA